MRHASFAVVALAPAFAGAVALAQTKDAGAPAAESQTHAVSLGKLSETADEIKDRIRRAHTREALLRDSVSGTPARYEVSFHNEMSSAFRLTSALVVLDGAVVYRRTDTSGALADTKEIPIWSGAAPPGDHLVQVVLAFQGNGGSVLTYLDGYGFQVKATCSFTLLEGSSLTLDATAFEKGDVTTPFAERPAIAWRGKVRALDPGALAARSR